MVRELEPPTIGDFRAKLDRAGYDIAAMERLGQSMGVDLVSILAGWAPIMAGLYSRPSWWRRVWNYLQGE